MKRILFVVLCICVGFEGASQIRLAYKESTNFFKPKLSEAIASSVLVTTNTNITNSTGFEERKKEPMINKAQQPIEGHLHFDMRASSLYSSAVKQEIQVKQAKPAESSGMVKQILSKPMRFSIPLGNSMVSVSKDQITVRVNFLQPIRLTGTRLSRIFFHQAYR